MQTGLDAVATQVIVGKSRAYAVFRESMRMDAQFKEFGKYR